MTPKETQRDKLLMNIIEKLMSEMIGARMYINAQTVLPTPNTNKLAVARINATLDEVTKELKDAANTLALDW